jgi:hypothetical protein
MSRTAMGFEMPKACVLTRRSVLAFAAAAPFLSLPAAAAERVGFGQLWTPDFDFSDIAQRLAGGGVEMRGYMAPPLKPEIPFFVLTKEPTAICPFCDSAAAWPEDIILVLLSRPVHAIQYDRAIAVTGLLEIGTETDEDTGFVSRARLRDAKYVKI